MVKEISVLFDPIERAARYHYVFRSSFKEYLGPGWAFSRRGEGPVGRLYASLESIKEIAERLKDVYVDHNDFRDCIRNWDSQETVNLMLSKRMDPNLASVLRLILDNARKMMEYGRDIAEITLNRTVEEFSES